MSLRIRAAPSAEPEAPETAAPPRAAPPAPMDLGQIVDAVIALYRRRQGCCSGCAPCSRSRPPSWPGSSCCPCLPGWRRSSASIPSIHRDLRPVDSPADAQHRPDPGLMGPIWLSALVTIVAGHVDHHRRRQAVMHLRLGGGDRRGAFGAVFGAWGRSSGAGGLHAGGGRPGAPRLHGPRRPAVGLAPDATAVVRSPSGRSSPWRRCSC